MEIDIAYLLKNFHLSLLMRICTDRAKIVAASHFVTLSAAFRFRVVLLL